MIASLIKSITKSKTGRTVLFEELVEKTHRQAYGMAVRMSGNVHDAEDLLQESYVRAFRFFHRYDEGLPFLSWLYRIMTNVHIDTVRKRTRVRYVSLDQSVQGDNATWDLPAADSAADMDLMEQSWQEPLELALKSMTPEFRTAVLLADVEELSYEEIAEIMETSVGTVRSRIHRGRRQLREYLLRSSPGAFDGGAHGLS